MVFVINSDNFEIEVSRYTLSTKTSTAALHGFPTVYSNDGGYVTPVNLWLNYLVNVKHAKDISSSLRAIKRYWNYLEANKLCWDHFPRQKSSKPTYRYRNDDLLKSVKDGKLKASTASLYMQHVIGFYEWAAYEKLFELNEHSKPFNYQTLQISNQQMMRHNKPFFSVQSTDLRIRVPDRNKVQSLSPLSDTEIKEYLHALKHANVEFRLHQLLQLNTGMRVREACTFPAEIVLAPPYEKKRYEITIGPANQVETKYGATRTIEISSFLMHELYKYYISERRSKRALKPNSNYLLLNVKGEPFSTNSIQEHFLRVKKSMALNQGISYKHRTHDLRSTYGTYRLSSMLDNGVPESDAITLLMGWMGHKNEATMWKYVRFLRKETVRQNALSMLDRILEEALLE
jgi:integrase